MQGGLKKLHNFATIFLPGFCNDSVVQDCKNGKIVQPFSTWILQRLQKGQNLATIYLPGFCNHSVVQDCKNGKNLQPFSTWVCNRSVMQDCKNCKILQPFFCLGLQWSRHKSPDRDLRYLFIHNWWAAKSLHAIHWHLGKDLAWSGKQ